MTDLREGQPEGKNHWPSGHHPAPLRSHKQKWDSGAPKRSKWRGKPGALPLLEQRRAAIPGGARIWTGALLRLTRLALTGGTVLWGVLRGISWRVLGEVRCGGQRGLRPSTPPQPHPGSSPFGAHVPQALAFPLVLPPRAPLLATAPHPPQAFPTGDQPLGAPAGTRPRPPTDRGSTRAGAPGSGLGSYPAVGCPHRRLPPAPGQLRTRPHLPDAARGLGAARLPPCSGARTP